MITSSRARGYFRMIREARPARLRRIGAFGLVLLASTLVAAAALRAAPPRERTAVPKVRSRELADSVKRAQRLVERIRAFPFPGTVASAFLPEKDLAVVLERKLVEDLPTSFETYAATLSAVGLIEPDPDLFRKLVRLYARQVAGFYDPAERKFYVVPERSREAAAGASIAGVPAAGLMEDVLLAHELTHALQDRRLDLDRRLKGLKDSTDALLALECLLEGEATIVMTLALVERLPEDARALLSPDTLSEMMSSIAGAGGSGSIEGAEGVPDFFVKELLFPYTAGTTWVERKRAAGGWPAVDALYRQLPGSTAEILHPDRPAGTRARLADADRPQARDLPEGHTALYADTLGEWVLRSLLERAGAGESAAELAGTWHDDRILFSRHRDAVGAGIGFLWRIRCGSAEEAARLATALAPLYSGRPVPARPTILARGDVVEVTRGLSPLPPS